MNTVGYHFQDCVLLQGKKKRGDFVNVIKVSSQLTVS